jgi:glycerophosphoryl diester phosphodiesterase
LAGPPRCGYTLPSSPNRYSRPPTSTRSPPLTLVIAHRGASADQTENSLAAFRLALDHGADGVELDVHVTANGEIVVFHDPELQGRQICNLQSAIVLAHRLPNGETIPTLREALDVITPGAIAFVELKGLPPEADEILLDLFASAPRPDRCHVHSFDHRIIRRLTANRQPLTANAGVLSGSYTLDPAAQVHAAGASALWQHVDLVDRPLAAQIHEAGYRLYAWTEDRPERMRRLIEWGVDGICTNRPAVAREVIG